MQTPIQNIIDLINVTHLDEKTFAGNSIIFNPKRIFGGQVIAQALRAMYYSIPLNRAVNSLHAYFLRMGSPTKPITYKLNVLRDGQSFSSREVLAYQEDVLIFSMIASFHDKEEGSFETEKNHLQSVDLSLPNEFDRLAYINSTRRLLLEPFDIRSKTPVDYLATQTSEPIHKIWYKTQDKLIKNDWVNPCLFAFISDFHLLEPCLFPIGATFWNSNLQVASLDHAIWFHKPFEMDRWIYAEMSSSNLSGSRGFSRGEYFDDNGHIIASAAQEGLIRKI